MPRTGGPITVLIVDDSELLRRGLRSVFEQEPGFIVVGEAESGDSAIDLAHHLKPQLITMDIDMPGMNGLDAIEWIMADCPTRILVVTAVPHFEGLDTSFEALSRGALDMMPKPTVWPVYTHERREFVRLARRLATLPVVPHVRAKQKARRAAQRRALGERNQRMREPTPIPIARDDKPAAVAEAPLLPDAASLSRVNIIGIGASTGGPGVVRGIIDTLPRTFPVPIVVVQHLAEVFAGAFVQWLGRNSPVPVEEAQPGMAVKPGRVYVAVRGAHIGVAGGGRIQAWEGTPRAGHRPSVDVLFESMAWSYGPRAMGVLLTGMGRDGATGLKALANAGGLTVAQDEASSIVYGMPAAAVEDGAAGHVLNPTAIANLLGQLKV